MVRVARKALLSLTLFALAFCALAQQPAPTWTAQEQPIFTQIKSLRSLARRWMG